MPVSFGEFQQAVAQRIQDAAQELGQPSVDACIKKAIKGRYSQVRPLERVSDFAGNGATYEWEINDTNFPGWVDEASFFKSFEYPANQKIQEFIDGDAWQVVRISSSERRVRLLDTVPQTGKTLRALYVVPHSVDVEAGTTTVSSVDFEAIADLVASFACVELAAAYNQAVDPVVNAPTGEAQLSKSQQYLQLAKKYEAKWESAMGINAETKQPAAGGFVEWPSPGSGGGPLLTH